MIARYRNWSSCQANWSTSLFRQRTAGFCSHVHADRRLAGLGWNRRWLLGQIAGVIIGCATLVGGCGFHLRGEIQLPTAFTATYVEGTDSELVTDLKVALRAAGAGLVNTPDNASARLELVRVDYGRTVRRVNAQGIAVGYELRYDVTYRLRGRNKQELVPNVRVVLKRALDYSDLKQVLQKEIEEKALRQAMREEIVRRMIARLANVTVGLRNKPWLQRV